MGGGGPHFSWEAEGGCRQSLHGLTAVTVTGLDQTVEG